MFEVQFFSLSGRFERVRTERFETLEAATAAVRAHVEPAGFTNLRLVDDHEFSSLRFTARTPGGRGGRNVAFVDCDDY